jgi:hypothetical protein
MWNMNGYLKEPNMQNNQAHFASRKYPWSKGEDV